MSVQYTLIDAGPATVVDSVTKDAKPNKYEIQIPNVATADYPQHATKTLKNGKSVVVVEVSATDLKTPSYTTSEAFQADATAFAADAWSKALEAVNAVLANDTRSQRIKIGKDTKVIPADPASLFVGAPEAAIKAFWTGVQRAESAKAQLDNVRTALAAVDMDDPEAMKRALAAAMAVLKF